LGYDMGELSCAGTGTGMHAPLRLLTSVQEQATSPEGKVTVLPATTFEYGRVERTFSEPVTLWSGALAHGSTSLSGDKAGGWPTIGGMLLDLDGDGALDQLSAGNDDPKHCTAQWGQNLGHGEFAIRGKFGVPDKSIDNDKPVKDDIHFPPPYP